MSGISSIIGGSDFGTMQQLLANATSVKTQLDQLTQQASSGYTATTYSGLAPGAASTALSLAPQIAGITNTIGNLNLATGRMDVQQTALSSISTIASNFMSQLGTVNSLDPQAMATIAASAQQALGQMAGLLNTQDGNVYVFAGQDSANPPVPDANNLTSSGFYTQIGAAVAGLAANGVAATESSTLTIASSNAAGTTVFSAGLSSGAALPMVATGSGSLAPAGIAANANAFVASTGASTTGSYMRDILRGLATIAQITPGQVNTPQFSSFAADTKNSLQGAIAALNQDAGVLGNTQASLADRATTLQQSSDALSKQLASADQVDMAATLSKLSTTQTQLQASYQLIASMKTMSLTQYL